MTSDLYSSFFISTVKPGGLRPPTFGFSGRTDRPTNERPHPGLHFPPRPRRQCVKEVDLDRNKLTHAHAGNHSDGEHTCYQVVITVGFVLS